jgi:hypothetical protein
MFGKDGGFSPVRHICNARPSTGLWRKYWQLAANRRPEADFKGQNPVYRSI